MRDRRSRVKRSRKRKPVYPLIRKSQTSTKLSFVRMFFPDTKNKLEPDVCTNPHTPETQSKKIKTGDSIVNPKERCRNFEPEPGSKRKRELLEERKSKKQTVSPSIGKKIIFV